MVRGLAAVGLAGRRILQRHRHRFERWRRTCRGERPPIWFSAAGARPAPLSSGEAVEDADSPGELIDPAGEIDARRFPTVHRLAAGLAQDRWAAEFETGLEAMLDRIAMFVAGGSDLRRG